MPPILRRVASTRSLPYGTRISTPTSPPQPPAGRTVQPSRRGVEGREQAVLGAHGGSGERVQQRRLARVGVADDRGSLELGTAPSRALLVPLRPHLLDLAVEVADALADAPLLGLDLLLAGSPARPESPPLPADLAVVRVRADEPRQLVVQPS